MTANRIPKMPVCSINIQGLYPSQLMNGFGGDINQSSTVFITEENAGSDFRLPVGNSGDAVDVVNNSESDAKLLPAESGTLNGLTENAAVIVPAKNGVRCFCSKPNNWLVFEFYCKAVAAQS